MTRFGFFLFTAIVAIVAGVITYIIMDLIEKSERERERKRVADIPDEIYVPDGHIEIALDLIDL